jgi:hypothetical protein
MVAIMDPVSFLPFKTLGLTLLRTFLLRSRICSTKSALRSESSIFAKFYRFSSLVRGLIIVQQSLSLKKLFSRRLILFLDSTLSEKPFCVSNAFSK